jgi:lipopolysaccharide transport system permease protein
MTPTSASDAVDSLAAPPRAAQRDAPPDYSERTVIAASKGWQAIDLKALWRYRELMWFLALRDIKVRYKQTALGALWAIIQPLFNMLVFTVFFGKLAGLQSRTETPYAVLTLCALLPWQFFSNALTNAGNSLVNNQNLISKVYFPRLTIPISSIIAGLVDFAVGFVVLLVVMAFNGVTPSWQIISLPLFIVLAIATALAVGLWLSALNVEYRDVRYTIPFLTQFWMFITPVAYPSSIVPPEWRALYSLNPMVGVVDGFRWALADAADPPCLMLVVSSLVTVALLVGGVFYFRRMERTFADIV